MASASSGVRVTLPPVPELIPLTTDSSGSIWMTFAPRLAMVCSTEEEEPRPISIIAITAATPMTIPRMVRVDRMIFRRRACKAIRCVPRKDFIRLPFTTARDEWVFRAGFGSLDGFASHNLLTVVECLGHQDRIRAIGRARFNREGFHELAILKPDGGGFRIRLPTARFG